MSQGVKFEESFARDVRRATQQVLGTPSNDGRGPRAHSVLPGADIILAKTTVDHGKDETHPVQPLNPDDETEDGDTLDAKNLIKEIKSGNLVYCVKLGDTLHILSGDPCADAVEE